MNDAAAKRPSRRLWLLWLGALAAAVLIWLAAICVGIVGEALRQEVRPADAIVVFGAAEYSGRPSPVYRARLDHAFDLFEQGVAPVVITTGGAAADPSFSEGGVGHDYLMHRGIPDSSLIEETHGSDTAQSAERIGVIMRANHLHSCVAVSDAYHVFRIRKLLEHEGMQVYVSPRPDSRPHSLWQRGEAVLREALSYMVWRVQGLA
jgi:uncharacterized SAM-binding protein YcdF (DUF218 family)